MTAQVKTQNGGTLNLRQNPTTSSRILTAIPNGTKLEIEKYNNEWAKITYKDYTGYAMLKFLVEIHSSIDKADLQRIYDDLKNALSTIESILK